MSFISKNNLVYIFSTISEKKHSCLLSSVTVMDLYH